jgi:hypothetical protein
VLVVAIAIVLNARFTASNGSASSYGASSSVKRNNNSFVPPPPGIEPDADFHEPHVQLRVRLHARRVQRHLGAAAERQTEWRDDDGKGIRLSDVTIAGTTARSRRVPSKSPAAA